MKTPSDNPIRDANEDVLGRTTIARNFAQQILDLDASEGLVVGVLGPWGSGKTSFINLARPELDAAGATVINFNPWMFSGAEQLVESFFVEVSAQMKLLPGFADIGKDLEDYGEAFSGLGWLPLVGPWIERSRLTTTVVGKLLQRRKEGTGGRRTEIEATLLRTGKKLIVVLDDIDRLSTKEIREVFKLVRLTACFPNFVYVVAFDRTRVEGALSEEGVPGRDYLEKILQVAIDLPAIPDLVLRRQILHAIERALEGIEEQGPFSEREWADIFFEVIRPLVRNMRDVRRYAAAIRGTVAALNGQIALADVLGLEAIRVFLPDVFARMHRAIESLTKASDDSLSSHDGSKAAREEVESLVEAGGKSKDVVRAMIMRMFPASQRFIGGSSYGSSWRAGWLRERRVAHEEIVRLYFERIAGEQLLAFTDAERAWALLNDRDALDGYLRSIGLERLEDVIGALENYEDQFKADQVVPASVVLLNLLRELPEREHGFFMLPTRIVVTRVIFRLLRSLKDPADVEGAVRSILPQLRTLSAKLELILQVGHRENVGHKMVPEDTAVELESTWRDEVMATDQTVLASEEDFLRILLAVRKHADGSLREFPIDDTPELTLAVLKSARHDVLSQTMGHRAVRKKPRLDWDSVVAVFGDEDTAKERIRNLMDAAPEQHDELIELASRYSGGRRPTDTDVP